MELNTEQRNLLEGGAYARKQILCKDRVIAWSHGSRFRMARELVAPLAGRRLLDFGCGDGTFLALVHDLFPNAVGADLDAKQTADCARRFAGQAGMSFILTEDLDDPAHEGAYDLITCMEVLEHCPTDAIERIVPQFRRLLAPGGTLIISVPIEIGPSLLGKEAIRTVAGWRRVGDYRTKEKYRLGELLTMATAGARTEIPRTAHPFEFAPGQFAYSHDHKGFNWKVLRRRLSRDFEVTRTRFSPLGWTRGLLSSQAWLIARPRQGS